MTNKQLPFTEALSFSNPRKKSSKTHHKLQKFYNLINWDELESLLSVVDKTKQGKGGRPPIALSIKIDGKKPVSMGDELHDLQCDEDVVLLVTTSNVDRIAMSKSQISHQKAHKS